MQQAKRHHFVPKAYLNSFCDRRGRLLIYRKDGTPAPLHLAPDATQFRRYYYSQATPEGGKDNNTLEQLFSTIESKWPETVAKLHRRENANDRLENIFEFMTLQRVRVPAARDVIEQMLAQSVRDTMTIMQAQGKLPPLPAGLEDLPSRCQISINPHKSIHGMAAMMQGMAKLYSMIGLVVVHNATDRPFLTSDNPVLWFDPSLPFEEQRPYTINPEVGPVLLVFPVSPKLAIVGSTDYRESFGSQGLQHIDVPGEAWVDAINEQVCRFAYEAVIAQDAGNEELIAKYVAISPVHEAIAIPVGTGVTTIHRFVFGLRGDKPKWSDE